MSEFLPEHKELDATVPAGQSAQVSFRVPNPGPISLSSRTFVRQTLGLRLPGPQRVDLFKPNNGAAVLSRTSNNGPIQAVFEVVQSDAGLNGNWIAKVTNLATLVESAHMEVAFPGILPVQVSKFPVSALETLINTVFKQVQIHLTRGTNASFISFPDGLGVPDKKFTIEDVHAGPLVEHPNDINSETITLDFLDATSQAPQGSLRLTIQFESKDREIKGTLGAEMDNMRLVVTLGLDLLGTSIVYNKIDAAFSADVNVLGIPDNFVDRIVNYKDTIKKKVEAAVEEALSDFLVCQSLSRTVTNVVNGLTGQNTFLADVRVEAGELVVTFFRVTG